MAVLNNPLFILALLAVMILLSALSGKLHGHADMLQTALVDKARLGNRIFSYFGFFGADKRDVDIRMYNQFCPGAGCLCRETPAGVFFRDTQQTLTARCEPVPAIVFAEAWEALA